jgi:hypothetical protein
MTDTIAKTYGHRVPGSSIITGTGKVLNFSGSKSGPGFLTTSDPEAIAMLDHLVRVPISQVYLADSPDAVAPAEDPVIAAAAAAAAQSAERAADPSVVAAQENLGKLIAAENQT